MNQKSFAAGFMLILIYVMLSLSEAVYSVSGIDKTIFIGIWSVISYGLPCSIYALSLPRSERSVRRIGPSHYIAAVLVGISGAAVVILLNIFSQKFLPFSSSQSIANDGSNIILSLICFAVIPAVLEEIAFRGIILRSFSTSGSIIPVIITAVLFAAMHMSAQGFLGYFAGGVFFGYIAVKSKKLILPVISHMILNVSVLIFSLFSLPIIRLFQQWYMFTALLVLLTAAIFLTYALCEHIFIGAAHDAQIGEKRYAAASPLIKVLCSLPFAAIIIIFAANVCFQL